MKTRNHIIIIIFLILLKIIFTDKPKEEIKNLLNLRKNSPFSLLRFQEGNKKELSDSEKLDKIDRELKFGSKGKNKGQKDKENIRISGLSNGLITYKNRRTMNVETLEFTDYYYDILAHTSNS